MHSAEPRSLQAAIRKECAEVVGPDFLKGLHEKVARTFLLTVLRLWAEIALAFAVAYAALQVSVVLFGVLWLPLICFIGSRANALNVQVHEGSHGLLADDRRVNDLLCNWLAAYPTLYDVDMYAAVHVHHHNYLSEDGDLERQYYEVPVTRLGLLAALLQDLFWITLVRRVRTIKDALAASGRMTVRRLLGHVIGRLVCMALMIGALTAVAGLRTALILYVLCWLVPLFSVFPIFIRVRTIAEHYAPPEDGDRIFVARTTDSSRLEHYFLGAQMEYHFEHHLFPSIPYPRLRLLHARLREVGFFERSLNARTEHSLSVGYVDYWRRTVLTRYALRGV
jgi:fatty acid desaturase